MPRGVLHNLDRLRAIAFRRLSTGCCVLGFLTLWSASALFAQVSQSSQAAAPRYLAFQMFSGYAADKAPGAMDESLEQIVSRDQMEVFFASLDSSIQNRGDGGRRLAVILGPLVFDQSDEALIQHIRDGFACAAKYQIAIGFHIDESKYWSRYAPFQKMPGIVEWVDWGGSLSTGQYLNWGREFRLNPQLCLNHPLVRAESQRRARDVFAHAIAEGIESLETSKQGDLFAGVIVGWETALAIDLDTRRRTGYQALSRMGLNSSSSAKEIDAALIALVQESLGIWIREFRGVGIPKEKLYAHIALDPDARTDGVDSGTDEWATSHVLRSGGAVPESAFSECYQPGFSTYPSRAHFQRIHALVAQKKPTGWASSEGANVYPTMGGGADRPETSMESYLAYLFNHGATLVNLFGWKVGSKDNSFRQAAEHPDAIQAYRKFLSGEALIEESLELAYESPVEQLRKQIPRMHASIQAYARRGRDMRTVQTHVQRLEKLLQAGRAVEALEQVDAILKLTGDSP